MRSAQQQRDTTARKLKTDDRQSLRGNAEARAARAPPSAKPNQSTAALLHELQVHQIELEMQNEELRRTTAELEGSRARYADLYERAPVGYVTVNLDGSIAEVNLAGEPLFGLDRHLLRGKQFGAFVDPDDGDRWHMAFKDVLTSGTRQGIEVKLRRRDGTHFFGWLELAPVGERSESVVRIALSDFTKHKEVEERLRAAQAQLEVATRLAAMGTLVAGVGHEINNPLTAALSGTALALETARDFRRRRQEGNRLDLESEIRELDQVIGALEDATEGSERIARVVNDLRTFGRSDSGKKRVRLIDIVNEAMRWLPATLARIATVKVENAGAPDVVAAFGQIEQVMVNLVTNAAKATPPGTNGTIVVRLGPGAAGMARLEVIDKGVGIDPGIAGRIFDPFFTTAKVGEGMGLGLAISHAIVTAHGGSLTVESEVGKGSTFRLELPEVPAEA
jgi:PAS domain S-box-containing protein